MFTKSLLCYNFHPTHWKPFPYSSYVLTNATDTTLEDTVIIYEKKSEESGKQNVSKQKGTELKHLNIWIYLEIWKREMQYKQLQDVQVLCLLHVFLSTGLYFTQKWRKKCVGSSKTFSKYPCCISEQLIANIKAIVKQNSSSHEDSVIVEHHQLLFWACNTGNSSEIIFR